MNHHTRPLTPPLFVVATATAVLLSLSPARAQEQGSDRGLVCAQEQRRSDRELLRSVEFEGAREDRHHSYGLVEGRKTISPLYHLASAGLYVWQNAVAPEVASPGGYADTNGDYFKALVGEYGGVRAVVYSLDRLVRNTRIGRHTTPKNERGVIEDSVERYHRKRDKKESCDE